jgi:hypothetical protein
MNQRPLILPPVHARISERAYTLYEEHGREDSCLRILIGGQTTGTSFNTGRVIPPSGKRCSTREQTTERSSP